jgi:hypothetical protein
LNDTATNVNTDWSAPAFATGAGFAHDGVDTDAAADLSDWFPALSIADTAYENVVEPNSPV